MSIITLTTDYGLKDHFVGGLKGKLYSEIPDTNIVDISHLIDPFNTLQASYIIGSCYKNFPDKTIHIILVDSELSTENQPIMVFWMNHYFICTDNGILSILTQNSASENIYEIFVEDLNHEKSSAENVFVSIAKHIQSNEPMEYIGLKINKLKEFTELQTSLGADNKTLKGFVNYIDRYGNAVTNITKNQFNEVCKGRSFEINFKNKNIKTIFAKYSDIGKSGKYPLKYYEGSTIAIFNEAGFIEIGIYRGSTDSHGSANSLLGLNFRDVVSIVFNEI